MCVCVCWIEGCAQAMKKSAALSPSCGAKPRVLKYLPKRRQPQGAAVWSPHCAKTRMHSAVTSDVAPRLRSAATYGKAREEGPRKTLRPPGARSRTRWNILNTEYRGWWITIRIVIFLPMHSCPSAFTITFVDVASSPLVGSSSC